MSSLVHLNYQGRELDFRSDGWFNATVAAASFGKSPYEWTRLPETERYLEALERRYGKIPYLKTARGRGGGTWMHPKLAVAFARWLDVDFSVWCDEQIDRLIRGVSDWSRARHAAASSHKVMCNLLQMARLSEGKETKTHHYMNESKLVNWAAGGEFAGLERDRLTVEELDALAEREIQNAVMIGAQMPYDERKTALRATRAALPAGRLLPTRKRQRRLAGRAA